MVSPLEDYILLYPYFFLLLLFLLYLSRFDRELTGKLKRKISFAKNEYENVIKTIKIYEYRLKPKEENDDK